LAQVAQSVEQRIENPRVGSSILSLGTIRSFAHVRACSGESEFLNQIKMMYAFSVRACSLDVLRSRQI
jgi:hypothetical protein